MANLSDLIEARTTAGGEESNLAAGSIIYATENNRSPSFECYVQWCACAAGKIIVEIWGAAGSSSRVCCCGISLPGNPPAYAKKEIAVNQGTCVCWCIGHPCGSGDNQINCSDPTMLCVKNNNAGNFCMCAEGGRGGYGICHNGSSSAACCFVSGWSFCNTLTNGCGWICNYCSGLFIPNAYGGDVNCPGQYSRLYLGSCSSGSTQCWFAEVKTAAGIFGTCPATIQQRNDCCDERTGGQQNPYIQAIAVTSKQPQMGGHVNGCWFGSQVCGCYEMSMCTQAYGPGIPGPSLIPCSNNKNHGAKGGAGAVKINFIAN